MNKFFSFILFVIKLNIICYCDRIDNTIDNDDSLNVFLNDEDLVLNSLELENINGQEDNNRRNRNTVGSSNKAALQIQYFDECVKGNNLAFCQNDIKVSRNKRSLDRRSLRVNSDITPPPDVENNDESPNTRSISHNDTVSNDNVIYDDNITKILRDLGIEKEVVGITEKIYELSSKLISNAKAKLCNNNSETKLELNNINTLVEYGNSSNVLNIIASIVNYSKSVIKNAATNQTALCSGNITESNVLRCLNCPKWYRSTKFGKPYPPTQYRPYIRQSTRKHGRETGRFRARASEENPSNPTVNKMKDTNSSEVVTEGTIRRELDADDEDSVLRSWYMNKKSRDHQVTRANVDENNMGGNDTNSDKQRVLILPVETAEFYEERKWPGGVLPYIISTTVDTEGTEEYVTKEKVDDLRKRFTEIKNILGNNTCVEFTEITEKETDGYPDYIVINTQADYVTGRVGGRQNFGCVELFQGGQHKQHTAMMVMAMLGFYFEISRHDRDLYIRVHVRHIIPGKLHHFEKVRAEATLPMPYDFKSATHPTWQFWRRPGKKGIASVATYKDQDPDGSIMKSLGQNDQLFSDGDLLKINSVYGDNCFDYNRIEERNN